MVFAPDTEFALRTLVNLVNTGANWGDSLTTQEQLNAILESEEFSGSRAGTDAELHSVRALRSVMAELWLADENTVVKTVNELLADAPALPQLV